MIVMIFLVAEEFNKITLQISEIEKTLYQFEIYNTIPDRYIYCACDMPNRFLELHKLSINDVASFVCTSIPISELRRGSSAWHARPACTFVNHSSTAAALRMAALPR